MMFCHVIIVGAPSRTRTGTASLPSDFFEHPRWQMFRKSLMCLPKFHHQGLFFYYTVFILYVNRFLNLFSEQFQARCSYHRCGRANEQDDCPHCVKAECDFNQHIEHVRCPPHQRNEQAKNYRCCEKRNKHNVCSLLRCAYYTAGSYKSQEERAFALF